MHVYDMSSLDIGFSLSVERPVDILFSQGFHQDIACAENTNEFTAFKLPCGDSVDYLAKLHAVFGILYEQYLKLAVIHIDPAGVKPNDPADYLGIADGSEYEIVLHDLLVIEGKPCPNRFYILY